jgi:hypothetical protein
LKKVDFGNKYVFKADSNPRPGQYEVESSQTKHRSVAAKIMTKTSSYQKPAEHVPEPGQYDGAV